MNTNEFLEYVINQIHEQGKFYNEIKLKSDEGTIIRSKELLEKSLVSFMSLYNTDTIANNRMSIPELQLIHSLNVYQSLLSGEGLVGDDFYKMIRAIEQSIMRDGTKNKDYKVIELSSLSDVFGEDIVPRVMGSIFVSPYSKETIIEEINKALLTDYSISPTKPVNNKED